LEEAESLRRGFFGGKGRGKTNRVCLLRQQKFFRLPFFLAVEEKERGKGYGSKILSFLKERYKGKSIFLAMEEMDERAKNYEERVKRQRFYQKNGLHPIPLKIQEGTVIYDVCASGEVNREDYTLMMEEYLGRKKCQKLPIKMYEE
jgi:GNAT superfamily N-acetyltransferase